MYFAAEMLATRGEGFKGKTVAVMGIVVQQIVGRRHGERYYPSISGVARSHNFYPLREQTPDDGVALVALGLGHHVVGGGASLRFSPRHPRKLPQLASPRQLLEVSQRAFCALDMTKQTLDFLAGCQSNLVTCDLSVAEQDGTLAPLASVYSPEDDVLRDTPHRPGPKVITFNNILKWEAIPLAAALDAVLQVTRSGMGSDVELELAVDLGGPGEPARPGAGDEPCLYVLQVRPMSAVYTESSDTEVAPPGDPSALIYTESALGNGAVHGVHDVVYVTRTERHSFDTRRVAKDIGDINRTLVREERPYLLIGPGRWGTFDPSLGIPVRWADISGARVIVETPFHDRDVKPSQGTHFFHNVTVLRIPYLTIPHHPSQGHAHVDRDWLDSQPALHETDDVRHVRLDKALAIRIDGRAGRAVVLKPPS